MTRNTESVGFNAIVTLINDSNHENKEALKMWLYTQATAVERMQQAMKSAQVAVQDGTPLAEMFKPA